MGDTGRADILNQGYGSVAYSMVGDEAILGGIHVVGGTFLKGVQLKEF